MTGVGDRSSSADRQHMTPTIPQQQQRQAAREPRNRRREAQTPQRGNHTTMKPAVGGEQLAHPLMMESTRTWMGFWSVSRLMMSKACFTIWVAISFLPLLRPCIIRLLVSLRARQRRAAAAAAAGSSGECALMAPHAPPESSSQRRPIRQQRQPLPPPTAGPVKLQALSRLQPPPLHNRALGLAEAPGLEAARRVGGEACKLGLHSQVVLQGDVIHLQVGGGWKQTRAGALGGEAGRREGGRAGCEASHPRSRRQDSAATGGQAVQRSSCGEIGHCAAPGCRSVAQPVLVTRGPPGAAWPARRRPRWPSCLLRLPHSRTPHSSIRIACGSALPTTPPASCISAMCLRPPGGTARTAAAPAGLCDPAAHLHLVEAPFPEQLGRLSHVCRRYLTHPASETGEEGGAGAGRPLGRNPGSPAAAISPRWGILSSLLSNPSLAQSRIDRWLASRSTTLPLRHRPLASCRP